ncbi:hypothetical protein [Streptomyces sp. NPDC046261]|uniref:hypothetical protein n=1 Tax=Streptomyces sp. NPDC046261 TaxID=3157200 RepID=UPI0033CBB18B
MTDGPAPEPPGRLESLLARARTRDRYAGYDVAGAESRLMRRKAARRGCLSRDGLRSTPRVVVVSRPPAWTEPARGGGCDGDRAWSDLTSMSLVVLHAPSADRDLERFVQARYADRTGALVFACLLHLADHGDGARFWWQFAAGAGDCTAEYCLFLDHARRGEHHDADLWGDRSVCHDFAPDRLWGDRAAAATAAVRLPHDFTVHITERHHPDLGLIPLPEPSILQELRDLTSTPVDNSRDGG